MRILLIKIVRGTASILLAALVLISCVTTRITYPEPLTQLHQNVMAYIFEDPANPDRAKELLAKMQEDGSWKNIDYTSQERGGWPAAAHLSNLLALTKAYQTKGTPFYHKKKVSEKIHLSLNYWLTNDFICPNWWYPQIGVPMTLAPVMILLEPELSADEMQKGIKILDRSRMGMTGQNKVWQAGNVLLKSLLLKDAETIRKASAAIKEELVVTPTEGLQSDASFHQHGPQLQIGNYGLSYVSDMIKWISILRNTPFCFDESKVSILRNYMLEGQQWVTWKNMYDITSCGRQLFPNTQASKAAAVARSFTRMETLDPEFASEYKKAGDYRNLSGNRHFWRSDYQIQRSPDYFISVKMSSERVIGAETVNSENLQGYYMGDGATFLYRTTKEYENIYPFWDWKKIPGTTVQQDDGPIPALTSKTNRVNSKFVGGVSDGKSGIAAMDYNRDGLKARKSWFMFNGSIVCLGSGINSSKGVPVTTSVNQSFLKDPVIVKIGTKEKTAAESQELSGTLWVVHDSTGYFFPSGGPYRLETRQMEGSWHRVASRYPDEMLKARIFNLYANHGINPVNGSYEYILAPNVTKVTMEQWENNLPFRIVNLKERQEVVTTDGLMAGIVFYDRGKSPAFGGIETDNPCILMVKKMTGGWQISLADPTQQLKETRITLDGEFTGDQAVTANGKTVITFTLPEGAMAGKSVVLRLKQQTN